MPSKVSCIVLGIAMIVMCGCAGPQPHSGSRSHSENAQGSNALTPVNRRIAAYNAHDIEAFLATYDEDVRIYVYPDRFLGQGRDRMRRIFGPQFAKRDGAVRVISQHALEDKVVNVENVVIADVPETNIAIYTIANDLIVEVRLIEPGG